MFNSSIDKIPVYKLQDALCTVYLIPFTQRVSLATFFFFFKSFCIRERRVRREGEKEGSKLIALSNLTGILVSVFYAPILSLAPPLSILHLLLSSYLLSPLQYEML